MSTLKVGQVGLGYWGKLLAAALKGLSGTEFGGVYDSDPQRCKQVAQHLNVTAFSSLDALLSAVEAVVVATPTHDHFQTVRLALSRNIAVLVEKPMTALVSEAETLVELAEQKGVILQVGHIERFNPAVRALEHEAIRPKHIEALRFTSFEGRGADVGVVLDLMVHDLDLVLSFVDSEVSQVEATGVTAMTQEIDFAHAIIRFQNGCIANLKANRTSFENVRQMYIYQDDSYYSLDFLLREAKKMVLTFDCDEPSPGATESSPADVGETPQALEALPTKKLDPLHEELKAFIHAIKSGTPPIVDGAQGKRVLELATEIMTQISAQKNA